MSAYEPTWSYTWIEEQTELEQVLTLLSQEPLLVLDTETSGWEIGKEQLCLLQIGLPSRKEALLIDALTVNLTPLAELFMAPQPTKIAHNADFEKRQLARHGIKLGGIADTLAMSRELRADLPNHTLKTCANYIAGITMSKEEQTSDWSVRPLSNQQMTYAQLDVEITFLVYERLKALEKDLTIEPAFEIPELMEDMVRTVRERLELTRPYAHRLAVVTKREEMLKEAVRAKLVQGSAPYDGEFGKASVAKVKKTEINPNKVRETYPEIAELAVQEYVDRKRFIALLLEHGYEEEAIEAVIEVIGFNERLNLSLKSI